MRIEKLTPHFGAESIFRLLQYFTTHKWGTENF